MHSAVFPRILAEEYRAGLSVHVLYCFLRILAAEYRAGLNVRKEMARVPSVYCTVSPRILAAEYTAGLKMTVTKWQEFRPYTWLCFLEL